MDHLATTVKELLGLRELTVEEYAEIDRQADLYALRLRMLEDFVMTPSTELKAGVLTPDMLDDGLERFFEDAMKPRWRYFWLGRRVFTDKPEGVDG